MDASSSKAADVLYPREHGGPSLAAMTLFVSLFLSALITAFYGLVDSSVHPQEYNDGIHLAVSPKCGELSGNVTDANAGLDLRNYKTIVSFGDSYTDGGKQDGSPLNPPIVIPPDPGAGGRSTNGKVWVENIADDFGARLMDYAVYHLPFSVNTGC
ncbi:hypothetical protein PHLCEN_2v7683 [Hermanssonia centrifuga]|uniref:Uncharacterized protein n=1 Tax=Hermanssonia centrifuga TaxID=98765 RepID=A0A2R6NWD3_9APHY|nr:hypothetical protein PHLCEN_2v7683 [Hermanssonia centrifuga]